MDWYSSLDELSYAYRAISKKIVTLETEFMYGGYLDALAAPLMAISVWTLMGKAMDWRMLLMGYLMTLIIYEYDYYREHPGDSISNPERSYLIKKRAGIYPAALALEAGLLLALLVAYGNMAILVFGLIIAGGGAAYTLALKGVTGIIPGFKNIYTALIWAMAAVSIPALQYSTGLTLFGVLAFSFIFLKCLVNIVFFDIKDIVSDGRRGLKTIPVLLGIKKTILLLHGLNVLTVIPILIGVYLGVMPVFALAWLVLPFYVAYYLFRGGRSEVNIRHVSYSLADTEFLLWPILLILGKAVLLL
jgi:4-hydroxybenzoate polyprenyltransferase